uniref:BolA-like protein 1 n=1 Tax=Callorhinchus milii TaxID=7868 RepID=V9LGX4_CALMI
MKRFLALARCPAWQRARNVSGSPMAGPVERTVREKLEQALQPSHMEVTNESSGHAVPPGSETHFKVVVVSQAFEGLSAIQRHRLVNGALSEELAGTVHALSIHAKTPGQWAERPRVEPSPPCAGGSKHDPLLAAKLARNAGGAGDGGER